MNVVIINGLKITTNKRYIKFTKSTSNLISDTKVFDTFLIEFTEGALACNLVGRGVTVVNPCAIIEETDYIKLYTAQVSINGLVVNCLAPYEYQFNQFIVAGLEKFYMSFDEAHCTVLIPKTQECKFDEYIKLLSGNPYLEIVDSCNIKSLNNIYGFQINKNNVSINSSNNFVFNPKQFYERYIITDIDYLRSFRRQLGTILREYGVSLKRYPIDETTRTADRVIYKVTEFAKQDSHKSGHQILTDEMLHHTSIDFEATFLNDTIHQDFINRYQNLDLVSNFTTFQTVDKRGRQWIASVKWDPITTDRSPEYSTDGQGNSGITCTFRCEIQYWVVYDKLFRNISEVISKITMAEYPNGAEVDPEDEESNQSEDSSEETTQVKSRSIEDSIEDSNDSDDDDEWMNLRK